MSSMGRYILSSRRVFYILVFMAYQLYCQRLGESKVKILEFLHAIDLRSPPVRAFAAVSGVGRINEVHLKLCFN